MIKQHPRRGWLRGLALSFVAATSLVLGSPIHPSHAADEGGLAIELNKTEDTADGCRSLFLFDNATGHQLNRFQVDLILFDQDGVYSKQVVLDMAPLYAGKKMLASFLFDQTPCAKIGSILVNDVPRCENGAGTVMDCVGLLEVKSRSEIPLEK